MPQLHVLSRQYFCFFVCVYLFLAYCCGVEKSLCFIGSRGHDWTTPVTWKESAANEAWTTRSTWWSRRGENDRNGRERYTTEIKGRAAGGQPGLGKPRRKADGRTWGTVNSWDSDTEDVTLSSCKNPWRGTEKPRGKAGGRMWKTGNSWDSGRSGRTWPESFKQPEQSTFYIFIVFYHELYLCVVRNVLVRGLVVLEFL